MMKSNFIQKLMRLLITLLGAGVGVGAASLSVPSSGGRSPP